MIIDLALQDRTLRIRYGTSVGSALYAEFDGIAMVLTAAHLVKGIAPGDKIGVGFQSDWKLITVESVAVDTQGFDICAIRTATQWGEGWPENQMKAGMFVGEEFAYCGFPLSLEMHGTPGSLGWPKGFVKSAIFSGAVLRDGGGYEFLFDTINNVGFSGGPIAKREDGILKVVALVSGYKYDAPAPLFKKEPDGSLIEVSDYFIRPNSGFMVGSHIERAIVAAKTLL